ncbi:MAG: dTMP kinase [Candidatus Delongbacteria bacterium]|nr:dTMP kinase [Candidatus Delongbacteria bacterium]MBN2837003.1 dTMP kinase [Candidatus Delongbacteria bacterium]
MKGKFITFEGIDGSGKTTQVNKFLKALESKGIAYKFFREPGGTRIGENLREFLLDNKNNDMKPVTELLLYCASRAQLVPEIIDNLEKGLWVVCDRFIDSTLCYQGYGRGLDKDFIRKANEFVCSGKFPDVTFYIKIDYKTSIDRQSARNGKKDRLENEESDFFYRLIDGFDYIAREYNERISVIDGSLTEEEVFNDVLSQLRIKTGVNL